MTMKGGMNSQPAAAGPMLIKNIPTGGDDDNTTDLRRLIPAWIISGVIHVVLLSLFLLVTVSQASSSVNTELSVIESKVDDDVRDKNLTNDEIGNDPDLPTNYNVDRIEEVSVPGPVNPNESVGILNAPDGPPQTIPPPPGFGGNTGQGGGIDDPNRIGAGNIYGTAGGMGGPKMIPGGMGGRSGATREKMVREGGGNSRSEACVAAGLKWLSLHQSDDGSWGPADFHLAGKCNCSGPGHNDRMFGTALALLPFLGAGETHKGTGKHSAYAKTVERALKWMVSKQNGDGVLSGNGYIQGMAALTLCEAYGLTADPQLKGPAQRAINSVVNWQGPDGGFRYSPKQAGDTSVFGWHVQACKSGQMAGLNVPNATFTGINNFMDKVSTPDGGGVGYVDPKQPTPRMTAVGMLCRQYMGWGPRHPGLNKGVAELRKLQPAKTHKDMYFYYYATQVMHHMGGEAWETWNPKMRDMLVEDQDQGIGDHRHQKGSWDSAGWEFGGQFGRLGHTCLCILTLEVYYRHLPLYRREMAAAKDEPVRNGM